MTDVPVVAETPNELPQQTAATFAADAARARELYKYFKPPVARAITEPEPPDTVLTALAQLVAWRFNADRAMVSLIDRETQYFIAESTKTLQLDDPTQYEDPDDAIWAGCISVPKAGRLCEHTIAALPPQNGGPACFEVLDLSTDDRFNTLPFVSGAPHFRYYIGVPLRTKRGINIGSIFALDTAVRTRSTASARRFLGVMADNVVQYFELMKDKEDRKRSATMNRCMSAFVDPDHQIRKRSRLPSARSSRAGSVERLGNMSNYSKEAQKTDGGVSSPHSDSDDRYGQRIEGDEHLDVFTLAADLLRDGLDLEDGGGGIVFLDTTAVPEKRRSRRLLTTNGNSSDSQASESRDRPDTEPSASSKTTSAMREPHAAHVRPATVIAQSHRPLHQWHTPDGPLFTPMSPPELSSLIKRHPRGGLFTFEDSELVSSSSDEDKASRRWRKTASKSEVILLRKCFPTARQLIFVPLWDSTTSRWSACFAYNCSKYRSFANNPEYSYCVAFGNCIMTEIGRLATLLADQQKSDFIGSISHELRSPLHGILASCEFLGDTDCSSFQRSLVDTADSCARTLLDTINMVLDYSKINKFEKNTTKARRSRRDILATTPSLAVRSHLSLYGDVDLAAITEEVVEGVATGHMFRDSLAGPDVHDVPDTNSHAKKGGSSLSPPPSMPEVEIVVDIARRDWVFWSQAGALRRIVMNLFGNSLKYTKRGLVRVDLEADDIERINGSNICAYVTLTVTDTGQGISPEYMRTKLFTPFAQESSLTPGTGLGLSLVKSIVDMLQGEIEVESTLGVGTKCIVRLPMTKGTPHNSSSGSGSPPASSGSTIERVKDDSIDILRTQAGSRNAVVYKAKNESGIADQQQDADLMHNSITAYLRDWYGFQVQTWNTSSASASDIIIVEESSLHKLAGEVPQLLHASCRTMILVLCHTTSGQVAKSVLATHHNFEEIRCPFGPYKLARALRVCIERLAPEQDMLVTGEGALRTDNGDNVTPLQMEEVIAAVDNVRLSSPDPAVGEISLVRSGHFVALKDSVNAQMAMNHLRSPQISDATSQLERQTEFPFAADSDPQVDGTVSPSVKQELLRPERPGMALARPRTISPTRQEMIHHDVGETNAMSSRGALTNAPVPIPQASPRSPRMLLVDDNRINLRLLQTFMKKRKYTAVTNAEDGLQAVNSYQRLLHQSPPEPPDIILMDISMPIMNGFEATRRIREIEREYREQLPPMQTPPSCLIIALTGLASGRDQSEAFTSGVDLYITKPVSFAEVSRLLNNWEANGGVTIADGVPHGAAVAGGSPTASPAMPPQTTTTDGV